MFDWIFQLLNHSWVPWLTSGLILTWGLVQWFAMRRNLFEPLDNPLSEATALVEETPSEPSTFRPSFNKVDKNLNESALLGPTWSLFSKTLLLAEDDRVIHSTVRADSYFTIDRLIGNNLEDRYYRSVPGFLMSSGFFFTFIGLIAALYFASKGLASEDIVEARLAMQGLLHAAALKFLSSLAGFIAALLFSYGERWHRHNLARELEIFCQLLDERFDHFSNERLIHEQLQATRTQNGHLSKLTKRLDSSVALPASGGGSVEFSLEPLLSAIHEEGERISRYLNELTLERLPEALENRFQAQGGLSSPVLERIATRLEEAVAGLDERSGEGMSGEQTDLLNTIAEKLDGAIDALSDRAAPSDPTASLDPLIASVKEEGERLFQANEKTVEKILSMAQQGSNGSQPPSVEFLDLLGRIASQMEVAVNALGERGLGNLVEALRSESEKLVHTGETVVRQFLDELAERGPQAGLSDRINALDERTGDANALEPVSDRSPREREHWMNSSQNAMVPIMAEMAREMTAQLRVQRQEELQLMERVASEVNQSVAELNAKIGRATPVSLNALMKTVREKSDQLHQGSEEMISRIRATGPGRPPPMPPMPSIPEWQMAPLPAREAQSDESASGAELAEVDETPAPAELPDGPSETAPPAVTDPSVERMMSKLEETADALHNLSDRMSAFEAGSAGSRPEARTDAPENSGLIRSRTTARPVSREAASVHSLTERFVARQNRYRRHYRTKITYKSAS